jgi:hypothetical protein
VYEHILVFGGDESKALLGIEPFYCSLFTHSVLLFLFVVSVL